MRRRLWNIIAAASLLLALVFGGLWVWSFPGWSFGYYAEADQGWYWDYYLHSYHGRISYTWFRQGSRSFAPRGVSRFKVNTKNEGDRWPWLWADRDDLIALIGFFYEHRGPMSGPRGSGMGWRTIGVPYWFLVALAMVMPVAWFRRRGRDKAGLCPECGYDLRATPDRCPECGSVPSATSGRSKLGEEPQYYET